VVDVAPRYYPTLHPGALIRERCRDEVFAKDEDEAVRDFVYGEFGFMSLVAFFKKHRWRCTDVFLDC